MCASPRAQAGDTFYVGTLKGVGRIYQQTFIDTYAKVAFAKLGACPWARQRRDPRDRKTPITAAELLNDRVIPFFDEHEIPLSISAEAGFIRIFGAGGAPSELVRVWGSVITPREERGCEEDRIWHARTSAVSASSAG